MKFEQSLSTLSEHLVSCLKIDTSYIPKIYDDLTRCTNEQILEITEVVEGYYDTTTQAYMQLTRKLRNDRIAEEEADELAVANKEIDASFVFFD